MKDYLKLFACVTLLSLVLIGCKDETTNVEALPIGLEVQQENLFSGKTVVDGYNMVYKVTADDELEYTATLLIDEISLEAIVRYDDQSIDFDGKKAVLTLEQKEALLGLGEKISEYLFKDDSFNDFSMAEYTLLRLLEYWAKSPSGYSYQQRSVAPSIKSGQAMKSADEGITCIKKNTYVTAEYDDDSGDVSESILVNGSDCIGRCGSGCGSWLSWRSAWTKDCLDHDRCGRVNGGSTNPFDSECGDEYDEAADDFLFGVIRGCSG